MARRRLSRPTDRRRSRQAAATPGAVGGRAGLQRDHRRRARSPGRADLAGWRARAPASLVNVWDRLWALRQYRQSGASAGGSQTGRHAVGDVANGLEPGRPNLRVGESVGLEKPVRFALNLRLYLDLPLVGP